MTCARHGHTEQVHICFGSDNERVHVCCVNDSERVRAKIVKERMHIFLGTLNEPVSIVSDIK